MDPNNRPQVVQYTSAMNATTPLQLPSGCHLVQLESIPTNQNQFRVVNTQQIAPIDQVGAVQSAIESGPTTFSFNFVSPPSLPKEDIQVANYTPSDRRSISVQCDEWEVEEKELPKPQERAMLEHLNRLRLSEQFCDVVIHAGPTKWYCHACILSSIPKLQRAMQSHTYPSQSLIHLKIPNIFTPQAVAIFLNRLYCSPKFELHLNSVYDVYRLATYLQHRDLVKECKKFASQISLPLEANPQDALYPLLTITDEGCIDRSSQQMAVPESKRSLQARPCTTYTASTKQGAASAAEDDDVVDETKKFMCESCGKRFRFRHLVRRHYEAVHLKLKPYKCEICDLAFSRPEELKQHRPTHTGARDYRCSVCAKTFRQHSSLYLHMKLHSEGKKYTCDVCGYRTHLPRLLKHHQQTHEKRLTVHQCKHCHKKFKTERGFRNHQDVHAKKRASVP